MTASPFDLRGSTVLLTGASGGLGGHFATVLHAAGAQLLLASHAGRFMTGSDLVVDGGHLCSSL